MASAYLRRGRPATLAAALAVLLAVPLAALAQDRLSLPRPVRPQPLAAEVTAVEPFGPAYRAGLEVGDRILEVNGTPVRSLPELRRLLTAAGDYARLTVQQRRTLKEATVHVYPEKGRIGIDARMVAALPHGRYPY